MEKLMRVRESFLPLVSSAMLDRSKNLHSVSFTATSGIHPADQEKVLPLFFEHVAHALQQEKLGTHLAVSKKQYWVVLTAKTPRGNEILKELYGWKTADALRKQMGEENFDAWTLHVQKQLKPLHPDDFNLEE
jgi:hypothetical protein